MQVMSGKFLTLPRQCLLPRRCFLIDHKQYVRRSRSLYPYTNTSAFSTSLPSPSRRSRILSKEGDFTQYRIDDQMRVSPIQTKLAGASASMPPTPSGSTQKNSKRKERGNAAHGLDASIWASSTPNPPPPAQAKPSKNQPAKSQVPIRAKPQDVQSTQPVPSTQPEFVSFKESKPPAAGSDANLPWPSLVQYPHIPKAVFQDNHSDLMNALHHQIQTLLGLDINTHYKCGPRETPSKASRNKRSRKAQKAQKAQKDSDQEWSCKLQIDGFRECVGTGSTKVC